MKTWNAIDRFSIRWKSDESDKIKQDFFESVNLSILPYGCTTCMLQKRIEKTLLGDNTRMLNAVLKKSSK